ncbi:MAG: hypothetical protein PHU44_06220 [Syntrophales bacterium]|nr:hypothetical protein [Syntrophales bacterium]
MVYLTLVIAVATATAAYAAWRTANETKKIVLAQITMQIREQLDSIKPPSDIKEKILNQRSDFEQEIHMAGLFEGLDKDKFYGWILNYYQVFNKLMILCKTKCINEKFIMNIILKNEIEILFKYIEPLEAELRLINETTVFEFFRSLYKN